MTRLLIHTDGAARGNPGPAGAGAYLQDAETGEVVAELAVFLGIRTNNYAEWTAVEEALTEAPASGRHRGRPADRFRARRPPDQRPLPGQAS